MSDLFLELVRGLARVTSQSRPGESPVAVRTKFLLFVLALLADNKGVCAITMKNLQEIMECGSPVELRRSIQAAEQRGFLVVIERVNGPNEYRLQRTELEKRQLARLLRANDSVYQLIDHGLPRRPLNALLRSHYNTMTILSREIEAYLKLPAEKQQGLHQYMGLVNKGSLGAIGAGQILAAYAAWKAAQPATDNAGGTS